MTPYEFRHILGTLDLTQVGLARLLGIGPRSARRYAAGHTAIPDPIAKMLRLAARGKISLADIEMTSDIPEMTAKLMRVADRRGLTIKQIERA